MTASRTLGSVLGVMLIGAAMGFDVLKVYGGGPVSGGDPFCFADGTGAQCWTDPPPRQPTQDTKDTCTGPGKLWGLPTGDAGQCAAANGTIRDAAGIIGYGGYWTPWFTTLGTLSALLGVAIIIYYLIYFRPYTNQLTVVGIITFLIGGVILEYFLMSNYHYTYNGPVSSATYFVVAVNTLVRLWVLLDVGCYDPKTTISGVLAAEAGKQIQKVANVAQEAVKSTKELEGLDLAKLFSDKLWPSVKGSLIDAGITDDSKRGEIRSSIISKLSPKPPTGGRKRK